MRNPLITLAFDTHGKKPAMSLIFEREYRLIGQQLSGHGSSKATEFFNCVQTDFSKIEQRNIINPLDDFS